MANKWTTTPPLRNLDEAIEARKVFEFMEQEATKRKLKAIADRAHRIGQGKFVEPMYILEPQTDGSLLVKYNPNYGY